MTYILAYPVDIEDRDGESFISFPDFPEAVTSVPLNENPYKAAQDCLSEAMAARILDGESIDITKLPDRGNKGYWIPATAIIAGKAILHQAMRDSEWTAARLADALGVDHKEARRILDPRHPTKPQRIDDAVMAVDNRYRLSVSWEKVG